MDPAVLQLLGKIVGPGGPYPLGSIDIGDQTYTQYVRGAGLVLQTRIRPSGQGCIVGFATTCQLAARAHRGSEVVVHPFPFRITDVPPRLCSFMPPAPQTLVEVFNKSRDPAIASLTFLVYGEERMTFAQVLDATDALARAFVNVYKVAKGDRIAIAMRNLPELVISYMAAVSIGAVAVPLNGWWTTKV